MRSIGIVGAGLAGVSVARTLRGQGYDGEIHLIGEEDRLPYDRPPLSKDFLLGTIQDQELRLHPQEYYDELAITLRTGTRVERIRADAAAIELSGGRLISVDRVVLATGGRPRRLAVPGAELAGVAYLRTADDAEFLRSHLHDAGSVVVVGGGLIGAEIAAVARAMGKDVTVVEQAGRILARVATAEVSEVVADIHRSKGVRVICGRTVRRLLGRTRVSRVELSDGSVLDADLVVVGVGNDPADELALMAGIACSNGIPVEAGGCTSIPEISAVGDVCNTYDPGLGRRVRSEHWLSAHDQGQHLVRSLLHGEPATDDVAWFWSRQYDHDIQAAGRSQDADDVVIRRNRHDGGFCALYLREERLVGAFGLDANRQVRGAMHLIKAGVRPTADELADIDVDLRRLARAG